MLKAELRALMDVRPNPPVAMGLWIWNDKGQIVYIYRMSKLWIRSKQLVCLVDIHMYNTKQMLQAVASIPVKTSVVLLGF